MANEQAAGNPPANSGGSNANKGPNRNNRRRSLRSKRRGGRKPEEGGEPREARETRDPREPRPQPNAPKVVVEKNVRDNRERRRRRRMRAKQRGPNETTPAPVVEDVLKDLPPLIPSFVYTHVIRPAVRDSFEFRSEHFSKVTRKLEDFHIDLSALYPDGGDEIKGVAYMPPETDRSIFDDDEEGLDDPEWDAEQSAEAAHLDGAIADDFYSELNDSVLDDSPEEDIDA